MHKTLTMTLLRVIACLILTLGIGNTAAAGADTVTASIDSVAPKPAKKPGLFKRIENYLLNDDNNFNKRGFHMSFIGGPYYSSDTKLGIGLVGTGFYRINPNDTISQPSNVTLYGNLSTTKFALIGVRGNNIFNHDAHRLNYNLWYYYLPTYVWGIGYDQCDRDENKQEMAYRALRVNVEYWVRLCKGLYIGPVADWRYVDGDSIERMELINNEKLFSHTLGIGFTINYDTRDLITNAYSGIYVHLSQMFRPCFLGNSNPYSTTEFNVNYYHRAWKGAVIATELAGKFNFGEPMWANLAELGGSNTMRGYYGGRYRDKHSLTLQVELRQHVWRRHGITLWAGGGNVFHDSRTFKHILPNWGIGYRWAFRKRVNIRLDMGFGKSGQREFIFNINEAF